MDIEVLKSDDSFDVGSPRMISQTAEYALRAVVFLASRSDPQTTAAISEHTQVSAGYLAKVMQTLSRAKLVHAQRGLNGGFVLASPPDKTTVLAVINAINPVQRFHQCPLNIHGRNLCPLHKRLDEVGKAIEEAFGNTTLADLLKGPKDRRPLCRSTTESG